MVDNVALPGTGQIVHADEYTHSLLGSGKTQLVRLVYGPIGGTINDVALDKPFPVQMRDSAGNEIVSSPIGPNSTANSVSVTPPTDQSTVWKVGGKSPVRSVTLSLDTSGAYGAGEVLAATQQMDAFFNAADSTAVINSVTVCDEDDQGASFDIYLFNANTSLGTENAAPSISDAGARTIVGIISIASTDYKDLGGAKVAFKGNLGIPVQAVSGTDDLYVGVVNGSGTPTFTASGVRLNFGTLQDN